MQLADRDIREFADIWSDEFHETITILLTFNVLLRLDRQFKMLCSHKPGLDVQGISVRNVLD
jgi:hypothetical protein